MKEWIQDVIAITVGVGSAIVILVLILMGANQLDLNRDRDRWNNGYHSCGGKWVYEQAVGHRYSTDYIYKCDKCGLREEFLEYRDN
jgi:hypothetical protein